MMIFRKQQKASAAQLQQVTAIIERVRSMREPLGNREVQLTELFSMLNEDETRVYWSQADGQDQ